jgi:teichuronic acid biosynthesis glycosyltransferase TuaC
VTYVDGLGVTPVPLRIVSFSTLFPNAAQPELGIFVEQRLRQLAASGEVELRVVAPVPWFPFKSERFGQYARRARAPLRESRFGLDVLHPRYLLLPKIGMTSAPALLAHAGLRCMRRLMREGFDFDLIDAHYYYPDGVAAALIARRLKKPFVVTARGTDINLIPRYSLPRRMIRWAAARAAASIAVCRALRDEMVAIGCDGAKIRVLRNGVDLQKFAPLPREAARARLGLAGPVALSVGHLIERKGHSIAIEALASLPGWQLLIVGHGPMERQLRELAVACGVAERVRFVGPVEQALLPLYYSAADELILASSREGMANVLLESLACGTPIVATNLWGTPEILAAPEAGELMGARSAAALIEALQRLTARRIERAATRAYAEHFGWQPTTDGQLALFRDVVAEGST